MQSRDDRVTRLGWFQHNYVGAVEGNLFGEPFRVAELHGDDVPTVARRLFVDGQPPDVEALALADANPRDIATDFTGEAAHLRVDVGLSGRFESVGLANDGHRSGDARQPEDARGISVAVVPGDV